MILLAKMLHVWRLAEPSLPGRRAPDQNTKGGSRQWSSMTLLIVPAARFVYAQYYSTLLVG